MTSLLPASSGAFERVIEESLAKRWADIGSAIPAISTAKLVTRPPSWLPFLVYEFGLGQLTPYVPNVYNLLDEGIRWQRMRGTYAGVTKALSFLELSGSVEAAWQGRQWWNSAQVTFDTLPASDDPLLGRVEGILKLSLPTRSDFRRGVHVYDAEALEADGSMLDYTLLEHESGIRLQDEGALWSFGRVTEIEHVLTEAEGLLIGNWIEPPDTDGLKWSEMIYPWVDATFPWADNPAAQRRALMASWFNGRALYATLRDERGAIIGHRLCRAVRPVISMVAGVYSFGAVTYQPVAGGRQVYVEALTDFDDCDGVTTASVELTVGAVIAPGIPQGRSWLGPDDLDGGAAIALSHQILPLRRTVREQFKFLLRF